MEFWTSVKVIFFIIFSFLVVVVVISFLNTAGGTVTFDKVNIVYILNLKFWYTFRLTEFNKL